MNQEQIQQLVQTPRSFFETGATLSVDYRIDALKKLRSALAEKEAQIAEAIRADLGKSAEESYMCETGLVISEISYLLGHIRLS